MENDLRTIVSNYFVEIDNSLEKLSHKEEGYIRFLPSWVLCNRNIYIGHLLGSNYYIIKAIPNDALKEDKLEFKEIATRDELQAFSPIGIMGDANRLFEKGLSISDAKIEAVDTFGPSDYLFRGNICFIQGNQITLTYSVDNAKRDAINFWNCAINGLEPKGNFMGSLKPIFLKFKSIISQKAFNERKTHRYINAHSKFLLPNHKKCYFEKEIFLRGDKRKADFILQREEGNPPILVELENPKSRMFLSDGELSSKANHAKNQIAEWVSFLDKNPENCSGEMSFLHGTERQRLVIMGRGLEFYEEMINSKYTDTIMWTYDMLLKEAKENWNQIIAAQCSILGIAPPDKF